MEPFNLVGTSSTKKNPKRISSLPAHSILSSSASIDQNNEYPGLFWILGDVFIQGVSIRLIVY